MTEKRFTINMEYECIDDAKKEIWIDFNDRIDFYELCEFLNKLNDENEQLKHDATVLICSNQEYRKENEQLKHTVHKYSLQIIAQDNKIIELEKENEQLKKRNNNQYNQLNQLWQLIEAKNWETLTAMNNQMKKDEERLQQEWKCYE